MSLYRLGYNRYYTNQEKVLEIEVSTKLFEKNDLKEILFISKHLLYFAIGNMIYAFIFGKFFDLIYPKRLREIQRNTKNTDKQDVLNVFHNYFYPKEYKKEFEKIFEKYYRKDEEKFRRNR